MTGPSNGTKPSFGPARILAALPAVLTLVGIGALLVLFALRAFHERDLAVDDAYILTRYASQFAGGHGFRWNITSPPVEGFTSPLFVVLLAGLLRAGFEPTVASTLLSIAAITGVVGLLVAAAGPDRPGFAIAVLPAAFLLLDPNIGVHASRGLETSVFFLIAASLVTVTGAVARRSSRRAGYGMAAVSFLLVLARPDGAIIVAVCWFAAALTLRWRTGSAAVLLPGAVALVSAGAAFAAWKLWYFGDLLPSAYYVKASVPGWGGLHDAGAFVADYGGSLLGAAAACLGTCVIAFRRAPDRWRHVQLESVIPALVALPWLAYSARIVHETGFAHRFTFVLVPLAALGVTCGLRTALDLASERRFARVGGLTALSCIAATALALVCMRPVSRTLDVLRRAPPSDPTVAAFTRLGRAIARADLGERISFLNGAAGAAPYFAGARHVDGFGLATRELSRVVPVERRKQIIVEAGFDVIEMPFLPASRGAESEADEPLRSTEYWREVEALGVYLLRFQYIPGGREEWLRMAHWMMRYLRDNMTLVGAVRSPGARMIVYVSRASPHYERLVTTLSRELDAPPAEVR